MKLFATSLLVLFAIGYVQAVTYSFTCVTGEDTTGDCTTDEADDDAAAKALAMCKMPDNSVVGNAFTTYGCGDCSTADNDAGTCTSCAAWDSTNDAANHDCNTYAAPATDDTETPEDVSFQCYTDDAKVDCTGAAIACFIANEDYDATATDAVAALVSGGCGTCTASGYSTDDCDDCSTDACNSAVKVASILAPLLALLFWMH